MSIQNKLSVVAALLLSLVAGAAACEKEEGDCDDGATQACACTSGMMGAQSCEDGKWAACVCAGDDGGVGVRSCHAASSHRVATLGRLRSSLGCAPSHGN